MTDLKLIAKQAREASNKLAFISTKDKNAALEWIAKYLLAAKAEILDANAADLDAARKEGMNPAMLDRLLLNSERINTIVKDLRQIINLPDPVGKIFSSSTLENGLSIHKQYVPLGVIAVIYESRPNVTVDVTGITLKSGNAAILRGGKESLRTNMAFVNAIQGGLYAGGLPTHSVQMITDPDRDLVLKLLKMHDEIDLLIPRGGAGLHQFCKENSRIPVITGGMGICHLFVDAEVDQDKALEVIRNAKIQRPTVCNSLDTVIVHSGVADEFLPKLAEMFENENVEIRADKKARKLMSSHSNVYPAGAQDFDTEWLSLVAGVCIVDSLDEAITHIKKHSTGHSDGILTENIRNSQIFIQRVDSAAVYVNASTRFTDGSQLGLGAEIAISTQRLHARGPMALEELMTYKWVIEGDYHTRK